MRRELLQAVMMAAMFGGGTPPIRPKIKIVDNPQHTWNLFGPLSEIAGKELEVIERNQDGDCMCIFVGSKGQNMIDVDHRDIVLP